MKVVDIIARKRDGKENTVDDLQYIARGAADGSIPDYQLSAWLMAAYLNPLNEQETAWLTKAMAESGTRIDLTGLPKPWVDKHSTGGVGDKTTLVLLPILAACGLTVVKMSGRGLGITGGTVDKLSSIPGFRLDLTAEDMKTQAARIGLALTGQSPDLAPADKALYALRDVTATVGSIPLIVSSILSKKIAGGAETIVLDVKCGSGAFMSTIEEANDLADSLEATGRILGLSITASISDMGQPLGSAVGNALEVREAMQVLQGTPLSEPSLRFRELCQYFAAETLLACSKVMSIEDGLAMAEESLDSQRALAKFQEWILAQGGSPIWEQDDLPKSPILRLVKHRGEAGWISEVSALNVGEAVIDLGGGRRTKSDVIDHSVGIELLAAVGSRVEEGQPLFRIHAPSESSADSAQMATLAGIKFSQKAVERPALILPRT